MGRNGALLHSEWKRMKLTSALIPAMLLGLLCAAAPAAGQVANLPHSQSAVEDLQHAAALDEAGLRLEAARMLRRLLRERPVSPARDEALYNLALNHIEAGEFRDAHERFDELLATRNNSPWRAHALSAKSLLYFDQGDYISAAQSFQAAADQAEVDAMRRRDTSYTPFASAGLFWSGISYALSGDDRMAEAPLARCADSYPTYEYADDALYFLAQFAERTRRLEEALTLYDRITKDYPRRNTRVGAHIHAAQNYISLRKPTPALEELESAGTVIRTLEGQGASPATSFEPQSYVEDAESQMLYLRGEAHNLSGRSKQALESFEAALNADLSTELRTRSQLGAGWALLNMGEYDRALAYYDLLLNREETEPAIDASARLYRVLALKRKGDRETAVRELGALTSRSDYPYLGLALLELGQMHYEDGLMDQARRTLERAVKEAPDAVTRARSYLLLGAAALDAAYYSTAATAYSEVIQIAERSDERSMPDRALYLADARFKRGIALVGASNGAGDEPSREATTQLQEFIAEHPGDDRIPEARFWLAEGFYKATLMHEAEQAYNYIVRNLPNSDRREEAFYGLGWTQFRTRQFNNASKTFGRLLREFPDTRFAVDVLVREGDAHYLNRNYSAAADSYRQVVRRDKETTLGEYALYQLGQSLYRLRRYDQAIAELRNFLKEFPRSSLAPEALYSVGWMLFESNRFEESIAEMRRLMQTYSDSPKFQSAHHAVADAYYNLGQYELALGVYSEIVDAYPGSSLIGSALNNMEYCLTLLGREEEAKNVRAQFFALNPGSPLVEEELFSPDRGFWQRTESNPVESYRRYVEDHPDSERVPEALYYMGKSYVSLGETEEDLEQYRLALDAFRRVVNGYPEHDIAPQASFDLAMTTMRLNEADAADSLLGLTRSRFPESDAAVQAGFEQAMLRLSRSDTASALSAFLSVADEYRGSYYGDRSRFRVGVYHMRRKEYDSARVQFSQVAERDDELGAEAQYRVAQAWYWQENYEAARDAAIVVRERFPEFEPYRSEALLILAWSLEKLEDIDGALETFRLVAALGADNEYAQTANANIERLQKSLERRR